MPESAAIGQHPFSDPVAVERIDDALDIVATAVERFGEAYMPLFIRLEEERSALMNRTGAIERVRKRLEASRTESRA